MNNENTPKNQDAESVQVEHVVIKPTVHIKTDAGLDNMSIELIQAIEKMVDCALVQYGFSRIGTDKEKDKVVYKYRQFGKAL